MGSADRSDYRDPTRGTATFVGQVCATLTLIAGAWLVIFSYVLAYPYTLAGVDGRPRDMALGFVLMMLGSARLRSPLFALSACILSAAIGVLLCLLPHVFDYGPIGRLNLAGWNEFLCGAVVLALAMIGLACVVPDNARVRSPGRREAQQRSVERSPR